MEHWGGAVSKTEVKLLSKGERETPVEEGS